MKVVTEQEARSQLSELADSTWDNHDVVVIAREGGRSTVMLSLEDTRASMKLPIFFARLRMLSDCFNLWRMLD